MLISILLQAELEDLEEPHQAKWSLEFQGRRQQAAPGSLDSRVSAQMNPPGFAQKRLDLNVLIYLATAKLPLSHLYHPAFNR